ncbi:MAG: rhodanese-like domain-containing protein [Flavobacteriales bacterium]|jgi:rhodanese-related sulfurtransferase|nr:rhodanese-like domain-containing protein [Flavobacteriales bacterium]
MTTIGPEELHRMRRDGTAFQLLDVREPYEAERCTLGGMLIPMGDLLDRLNEIRRDVPVVVHCRSGNRALAVITALERRHGFTNLIQLEGGIQAYAARVDPGISCD